MKIKNFLFLTIMAISSSLVSAGIDKKAGQDITRLSESHNLAHQENNGIHQLLISEKVSGKLTGSMCRSISEIVSLVDADSSLKIRIVIYSNGKFSKDSEKRNQEAASKTALRINKILGNSGKVTVHEMANVGTSSGIFIFIHDEDEEYVSVVPR